MREWVGANGRAAAILRSGPAPAAVSRGGPRAFGLRRLLALSLLCAAAWWQSMQPAAADILYYVRSGDTLYSLAQRFGTSVEAIKHVNNLNSDVIQLHQPLRIPTSTDPVATTHTLRRGETLRVVAARYGVSIEELRRLNGLASDLVPYGTVLRLRAEEEVVQGPVLPAAGSGPINGDELDLLVRLVSAEARGEPFEGMVAVAAVVFNRVRDPRFPNTIRGVIEEVSPSGAYQFAPVRDGSIRRPPDPAAYDAVNRAMSGWDPSRGALGFYNPDLTRDQWVRRQPVTVRIGNHVFFRIP